jgi:hypothetical protein
MSASLSGRRLAIDDSLKPVCVGASAHVAQPLPHGCAHYISNRRTIADAPVPYGSHPAFLLSKRTQLAHEGTPPYLPLLTGLPMT